MKDVNLTLHHNNITNSITKIIDEAFDQFSYECKNVTLAMSLKHQLQNYLFKQNTQHLTDDHIKQLSVYLQTIENILDQVQFSQHHTKCVQLSSTQYRMMYHVRYNADASLLT